MHACIHSKNGSENSGGSEKRHHIIRSHSDTDKSFRVLRFNYEELTKYSPLTRRCRLNSRKFRFAKEEDQRSGEDAFIQDRQKAQTLTVQDDCLCYLRLLALEYQGRISQ